MYGAREDVAKNGNSAVALLSPRQNLWLRSLTNKPEGHEETERLVDAYKGKEKNQLYESVMNVIVRANHEKFKGEEKMCEALREIMADVIAEELDEKERCGEQRVNDLTIKLLELGRTDDILKGAKNPEYQKKLFEEFGL